MGSVIVTAWAAKFFGGLLEKQDGKTYLLLPNSPKTGMAATIIIDGVPHKALELPDGAKKRLLSSRDVGHAWPPLRKRLPAWAIREAFPEIYAAHVRYEAEKHGPTKEYSNPFKTYSIRGMAHKSL